MCLNTFEIVFHAKSYRKQKKMYVVSEVNRLYLSKTAKTYGKQKKVH
jgi:hypothetical protein